MPVKIQQALIIITLMLFQDEIAEDKGLFTFYREQAEKEEESKRLRKLKRELKKQLAQKQIISVELRSFSQSTILKQKSKPKTDLLQQLKQQSFKLNRSTPKQRLLQSIVDMNKQIREQEEDSPTYPSRRLKGKSSNFVAKAKKYKEKIEQFSLSLNRGSPILEETTIPEEIKVGSYHRRNLSEDIDSSGNLPAIHSNRSSLQLPDIKKAAMPFRPKKSIKSQLVQQALRLKDRNKIKHIREILKGSPPPVQAEQEQLNIAEEFQIDEGSFGVFQQHQHKLMGIIRRFKRGL